MERFVMDIFLLAPNDVGRKLKNLLRKSLPDVQIKAFPAMKPGLAMLLRSRIYSPTLQSRIVILVASNGGELDDFFQVRELLTEVRLILILPDREQETLLKALALRPRFFTHVDGNLSWVVAVVQKMLGTKQLRALS
jgi:hypothetical protein